MKKQLICSFIAATLMSVTYATEPAANFVLSEFKGSADFGVKFDFADSDNSKIGMYNIPNASLKFGFLKGGFKTTKETDGIWGELKISVEDKSLNDINTTNDKEKLILPKPTVDTAKIHFINDKFYSSLNILKPSIIYNFSYLYAALPKVDVVSPLSSKSFTMGLSTIGNETGLENGAGFSLNLGFKNIFDSNITLLDNGITNLQNKKYGLAADLSINAIKDLTAKVLGSFNFSNNYSALATQLAYKININNTLYIKPGVAYSLSLETAKPNNHDFTAGLLIGWGKSDVKPSMKYISESTNEGVSLSYSMDFKKAQLTTYDVGISAKQAFEKYFEKSSVTKIVVSLYDESLFKFLNISDYGLLKTGFSSITSMFNSELPKLDDDTIYTANMVINVIAAGLNYSKEFENLYIEIGTDISYIITRHSMEPELKSMEYFDSVLHFKDDISKLTTNWSLKIGSHSLIQNTDLYALYEGEYKDNKISKNAISIGTKIHF